MQMLALVCAAPEVHVEKKFCQRQVVGLKLTLAPIAKAVNSIAWSIKALLLVGATSAALVGIIELVDHLGVG